MRRREAAAGARRISAFAGCLLACLAQLGSAADTLDVFVKLYTDANCFQRTDDTLLLDQGCYSNSYSNASRAFQLKIVKFDGEQEIDLREYLDDCNSLYQPKRTLLAGKCERFVGPFFVILTTRYRSSACQGSDCSRLSVAVQSFYSEMYCQGLAYETYYYPLQGECMRFFNGTQRFMIDEYGSNISQTDYIGDDHCAQRECENCFQRHYSMTPGRCFPLFEDRAPRSFSWTLEGGIVERLTNGTSRNASGFSLGVSLALAMAIAHASALGTYSRQAREKAEKDATLRNALR